MDPEDSGLSPEELALHTSLQQACLSSDLALVKSLLAKGAVAWYEDETGWSSLHYAASVGSLEIVEMLLRSGGIWNAVDGVGSTAAELAMSLNYPEIYQSIKSEGVRTEFLLNLLESRGEEGSTSLAIRATDETSAGSNEVFLGSELTYLTDENGQERVVDEDGNGVMMGWETELMVETARLLCADREEGLAVLNIGLGLGIVSPSSILSMIERWY